MSAAVVGARVRVETAVGMAAESRVVRVVSERAAEGTVVVEMVAAVLEGGKVVEMAA